MIKHILVTLGLNQYSDGDVTIIVSGVFVMCAIAGIVADFVIKPSGFGVVANGLILFLGFVLAMVAFQEVYQNVQRTAPVISLTFGMSIAFCALFALSMLKKALTRTS